MPDIHNNHKSQRGNVTTVWMIMTIYYFFCNLSSLQCHFFTLLNMLLLAPENWSFSGTVFTGRHMHYPWTTQWRVLWTSLAWVSSFIDSSWKRPYTYLKWQLIGLLWKLFSWLFSVCFDFGQSSGCLVFHWKKSQKQVYKISARTPHEPYIL